MADWLGHQDLLELWVSPIAQLKSGAVTPTPLTGSLQQEEIHQDISRLPAYSYNQDTAKMPRVGPGPAQPHHYSHSCYHLQQEARALNDCWEKCILGWLVLRHSGRMYEAPLGSEGAQGWVPGRRAAGTAALYMEWSETRSGCAHTALPGRSIP